MGLRRLSSKIVKTSQGCAGWARDCTEEAQLRRDEQSRIGRGIPYMTKRNKGKMSRKQKKAANAARRQVVIQQPQMSIGAQIGHGIQKLGESLFQRLMGRGDYVLSDNIGSIQKNALMSKYSQQPPTFGTSKSSFVFEHSEYIGDIVSSATPGAFSTNVFNISPSDPQTFPWLSQIANSFETYELEGLIFRYESTSGSAVSSTNAALGTVMSYVSYDVADPIALNKQTLLQYEGCCDAKTSENFLVGVECDPSQRVMSKLYVGNAPSGSDPRFYSMGNLVVCTSGQQAASQTCGELWAHYRIRFHVAKTLESNSLNNGSALYSAGSSTDPIGTLVSSVGTVSITKKSSTQFRIDNLIRDRTYEITLSWKGSSTVTVGGTLTWTNGANWSNGFYASGANYLSNAGVSSDTFFATGAFTAVASDGILLDLSSFTLGTNSSLKVTVTPVVLTTV